MSAVASQTHETDEERFVVLHATTIDRSIEFATHRARHKPAAAVVVAASVPRAVGASIARVQLLLKRGIDRRQSIVLCATTIGRSKQRRRARRVAAAAVAVAALVPREVGALIVRVQTQLERPRIDRSGTVVLHAVPIGRSVKRRATPDASQRRRWQSQRSYRERTALPPRECNRNSKTRYRNAIRRATRDDDRAIA